MAAAKPKMNTSYKKATHGNTTKLSRPKDSGIIKYAVVHYTGSTASAKNNCIYFDREGAATNASADFFIDKDGTIYQYNAIEKAYSWHCGDGGGKRGITNRNSVGIEVVSAGEEFTAKQVASLRKLVTWLMGRYGITKAHVVRHYDASRKLCPAAYAGAANTAKGKRWAALRNKITKEV